MNTSAKIVNFPLKKINKLLYDQFTMVVIIAIKRHEHISKDSYQTSGSQLPSEKKHQQDTCDPIITTYSC